ncbi:FtsX-like permease family protein [Tritonibacter aquimaris]|nr:FtsX-like permease family protein [Tritonibacter aquimaris]
MDFARAQELFGEISTLSYLIVTAPLSDIPEDLRYQASAPLLSPAELTDSFHLNLTAFGLLAFVVGLFIVQSTIKLALEHRRPVIRTLRSIGLPLKQLISLLTLELGFFALIGGGLGLVLGHVIASALLPGVNATLTDLYDAPAVGQLTAQASWALSGFFMTLAGTFIAGATSLWQIYKLPVLQGPAFSARGQAAQQIRNRGFFIGLALVIFAPLTLLSNTLIAGFILMGAILLGAVLMLPRILSALLTMFLAWALPGLAQWFWADMRAQLVNLSVPLMALSLAIAANIGVETMTSSFRLTFVGWINQRFDADLYIPITDADDGAELQRWLGAENIRNRQLYSADLPSAAHPTRIWGIVKDPSYAQHWPMIAEAKDSWARLHRGQGAMINEQMARAQNLWPGDQLMQNPPLVVLGVYPDYGNPSHQIMMSHTVARQISPEISLSSIAIHTDDKNRIIKAINELPNLGISTVLDQDQIRNQSIRVFDQTFVITAALNILTLGVAGFALLTSFLALWNQRLPQIAPLWAMGVPMSQIAQIDMIRSLGLALFTAILSVPLGLVLAWVLLAVTNVLAFGWQLPMYLFPLVWGKTVVLALCAAALACLPGALRLRRLSPSTLLKVFSSER